MNVFKSILFLIIIFSTVNIVFSDDENLTLPDYYWPISGDFVLAIEDTICVNESISTRIYSIDELLNYEFLDKFTAWEDFNVSIYFNGTVGQDTEAFYEFKSRSVSEKIKFPFVGRYLYRINADVETNYGISRGNIDIINCTLNEKKQKDVIVVDSLIITSDTIYEPELFTFEKYMPFSFEEVNSTQKDDIKYINISLKNNNMIPRLVINSAHQVWYYDNFQWNEVVDNEIPLLEKRKLRIAYLELEKITEETNETSEDNNDNNNSNNNENQKTSDDLSNNIVEDNLNQNSQTNKNTKPKQLLIQTNPQNNNVNNSNGSESYTSITTYLIMVLIGFVCLFGILYIIFKPNDKEIVLNDEELEKYSSNSKDNIILLETKVETFKNFHPNYTNEQLLKKFLSDGFKEEDIKTVFSNLEN